MAYNKSISNLKLTILILLIRDTKAKDLLQEIEFYTQSTSIQVNYILDLLLSEDFIVFDEGNFNITDKAVKFLEYRALNNTTLQQLLDKKNPKEQFDEKILSDYIPKKY